MRYDLTKEWQKISETSGLAENVSSAARIEISPNQDNGGLILDPGEQFTFSKSFYARKHAGGGAAVLAIFSSTGGTSGGGGSGSTDWVTGSDIDSIFGSDFPTHEEVWGSYYESSVSGSSG